MRIFFDFRVNEAKEIKACQAILDKDQWERYFTTVTRFPRTSAKDTSDFDWDNKILIAIHAILGKFSQEKETTKNNTDAHTGETVLYDLFLEDATSFSFCIDTQESVCIFVEEVETLQSGTTHVIQVKWRSVSCVNNDGCGNFAGDILVIEVPLRVNAGESVKVKSIKVI